MNHQESRILIVEDDRQIADFLSRGLGEAGFPVDLARDGIDGFERAATGTHAVIILDIMLPGMDGLELLRRLRESDVNVPVLILSARRSVDDRILGLRSGGDDYLVKPFAFAELLARVESLLRRARGSREPVRLTFSGITLDLLGRRAFLDREELQLLPQEFSLLEYLVRNAGRVVTRTQILQHVWGYNFNPSTNVVEVHVCRLRDKIERPGKPKLLRTVRGAGYILGDDEQTLP